eukprot:1253148-Pleurochrysis_carterae.AAC.2
MSEHALYGAREPPRPQVMRSLDYSEDSDKEQRVCAMGGANVPALNRRRNRNGGLVCIHRHFFPDVALFLPLAFSAIVKHSTCRQTHACAHHLAHARRQRLPLLAVQCMPVSLASQLEIMV